MSAPRLFWWWSEALKRYGEGRLVAIASDADEARQIVRDNAAAWHRQEREYNYRADGRPVDDDAAEDLEKFLAAVESDLAAAPSENTYLFVPGSE